MVKQLRVEQFIKPDAMSEGFKNSVLKAGILAGGLLGNAPTHDYSHYDNNSSCPECLDHLDKQDEIIQARDTVKFLKDNPDIIKEPFWSSALNHLHGIISGSGFNSTWSAKNNKVFMPSNADIYDPGINAIVAHERTHLKQAQKYGNDISFAFKYATNRKFRLNMEAEAYAADYAWYVKAGVYDTKEILNNSAKALSSAFYGWAADTPEEAKALILKYYNELPKK